MDYFKQLLNSFDDLKKRKFKLIYIEEAAQINPQLKVKAEDYINRAKAAASAEPPNNKVLVQEIPDSYVWVAVEGKSAGKVVFNGFPDFRKGKGIPVEAAGAAGAMNFAEFANLLGGQSQGSEQEQASQEQAAPTEALVQQEPIVPLINVTQNTLLNAFKKIQNFCKENPNAPVCNIKKSGLETSTGEKFTSSANTAIYGRLQRATKVTFNTEINGYVKDKLEDANVDIAADAYDLLVDTAIKNKDSSCESFQSSIFYVAGAEPHLLLKSSSGENSEGVVLKIGQYEKQLIEMAKQNCKKINRVKLETIYSGAKSQVKGALSETTVDFYYLLKKYNSTSDLKEKRKISQFVAGYLQEKIATIKTIADELALVGEDPTDVESAFINEVFKNDSLVVNDLVQVKKFIAREMLYQSRVINRFFPNASCAYNSSDPGTAKTGDRPDRQFIYTDKNAAMADLSKQKRGTQKVQETTLGNLKQAVQARCAGAMSCQEQKDFEAMLSSGGLIDKSNNTKLYLISSGLKRYKELDEITLGSIASLDRMDQLFTPNYGGDNRLAEGFLQLVDQKMGLDQTSYDAVLEIHNDLKTTREAIESTITSKYNLTTGKKPDFADPKQVLERVSQILKDRTLETNTSAKEIVKMIKKASKLKKDETGKYIDESNLLGRIATKINKFDLINKYQKLLTSTDAKKRKACEDYLIKQTLISGSTIDDNMYQTIIADDGSTSVIRHNEIFDLLLEARKAGNLKIEVTGTGAKFLFAGMYLDLNIGTNKNSIGLTSKIKKQVISQLNQTPDINSIPMTENIEKELMLFKEFFKIQNQLFKLVNK